MQYVPSKYLGIALVIISSICFAFVPNSAKVALNEGSSLSFLLKQDMSATPIGKVYKIINTSPTSRNSTA